MTEIDYLALHVRHRPDIALPARALMMFGFLTGAAVGMLLATSVHPEAIVVSVPTCVVFHLVYNATGGI